MTAIPPEAAWLAPGDIAAVWRIPTGTVYWLANRDQWRRRRAGRRTLYNLDDVTDTLDHRPGTDNPLTG